MRDWPGWAEGGVAGPQAIDPVSVLSFGLPYCGELRRTARRGLASGRRLRAMGALASPSGRYRRAALLRRSAPDAAASDIMVRPVPSAYWWHRPVCRARSCIAATSSAGRGPIAGALPAPPRIHGSAVAFRAAPVCRLVAIRCGCRPFLSTDARQQPAGLAQDAAFDLKVEQDRRDGVDRGRQIADQLILGQRRWAKPVENCGVQRRHIAQAARRWPPGSRNGNCRHDRGLRGGSLGRVVTDAALAGLGGRQRRQGCGTGPVGGGCASARR